MSEATLNGSPLPPWAVKFEDGGRPGVLTFEGVDVRQTPGGSWSGTLCFTISGAACTSFSKLCGGRGECKYALWSEAPYRCCPISLM